MRRYNESVVSLNVYSDEEVGTDIVVRVALDTEQAIEFALALDELLGFCEQRDFRVNGTMLAQWFVQRNQEIALF
jgi:hypothetical protein